MNILGFWDYSKLFIDNVNLLNRVKNTRYIENIMSKNGVTALPSLNTENLSGDLSKEIYGVYHKYHFNYDEALNYILSMNQINLDVAIEVRK